jgi:Transposase and inactivated derivatives
VVWSVLPCFVGIYGSQRQAYRILLSCVKVPCGLSSRTTQTEAAQRLCVSIKFINDMVRLKRETGSLAPKRQGNPGRGKLTSAKGCPHPR